MRYDIVALLILVHYNLKYIYGDLPFNGKGQTGTFYI